MRALIPFFVVGGVVVLALLITLTRRAPGEVRLSRSARKEQEAHALKLEQRKREAELEREIEDQRRRDELAFTRELAKLEK